MCFLVLSAYLSHSFLWISSLPLKSFWCRFVGKLFKEENHEFMAVVLHDWVKLSLKNFFDIRIDDPPFAPTAFAKDNVKEIVEFVVVFKVVFSPCLVLEFSIFLHDEIITEFIDGDQTL